MSDASLNPEIDPVESAVNNFLINGLVQEDEVARLKKEDPKKLSELAISTAVELCGSDIELDAEGVTNRSVLLSRAALGGTHLWGQIGIYNPYPIQPRGGSNAGAKKGEINDSMPSVRISGRKTPRRSSGWS